MIVCLKEVALLLMVKVLLLLSKAGSSKYLRGSTPSFANNQHNTVRVHHYRATTAEIPYHVLIAYHNLYCSGALIRSKIVVTAANCFVKWQGQRIVVKVGSDTLTGIGQVIEVIEIKRHEYFGQSSLLDNDIAMLMLQDHVVFDINVQKIILMKDDKALAPGTIIDVSSYAEQKRPKYGNSLLWAEMTMLEDDECKTLYPGLMTSSNFCAKYASERRLSDNGGPATFKDVLVGIVLYGAANTKHPLVAVLTNVSYFHKWITLNSQRLLTKYCDEPEESYTSEYIYSDDDY